MSDAEAGNKLARWDALLGISAERDAIAKAVAEERAAVVTWLREWARPTDGYYDMSVRWSVVMEASDAIERGKHRREENE